MTIRVHVLKRTLTAATGAISLAAIMASPALAENLTFVWHAGTCADLVYQISKDYPDKNITIVPDLVPYGPLWHDKIAAQFAIHGAGFDFAMWDSQSTAEFAGGGHAYSINKVFEDSKYLKANLFSPLSLKLYGEYPDDSGKYWGLPVNQDAYGMMYRKDLFNDPKEKAAFKAKYGHDLEFPQTYEDAKQVAEFFTRPDQGLYGWGQMGGVHTTLRRRLRIRSCGRMVASCGIRKPTRLRGISIRPLRSRASRPMWTCSSTGPTGAKAGTGTQSTPRSSKVILPWRCSGTISTGRILTPR